MPTRRIRVCLLGILMVFTACAKQTTSIPHEEISLQFTAASSPWLADIYDCEGNLSIVSELRSTEYLDARAGMILRIGAPDVLATPAYQIGSEGILVVANPLAPVTRLSADEVKGLFSGQITNWNQLESTKDSSIQIWVFPSGEDVEQAFERSVLGGTPITSQARLANTPDEMSRAVAADPNAVGVLPGRWKMGNVRTVYSAVSVPILVILPGEPASSERQLLGCLTK